eukprot:Protomagalhaensia_sp_Gyna_25__4854@NODE_504_length_3252_cov_26_629941_g395_i0_p1_GENE_NODE_504_length_3252_cov_26_629941_g395_i0NODE_504_length_3252_cov_26_629941_g395_i0_p1_ORF_typecomplete_len468_score53_17ANAPC4_WD40/PF12894_7/6_6e02ANAPC4_WD40/PF12894_7/27ANAPC4_WD40/PF12894_7/66ANAPC4_WD40/PF12894_7/2_4e05WD40/PF00400_32/6_8e03WD40/PF00400_32/1_1e04WD40/PF00400_32/29WD40/PF00400_32/1_3e04WD40/PF00400_32/1_1e04WD40/PF00400_32/7_9WD40/PF00400_32/0_012DPPIV_N/PF00930_21/0_086DPPIV_N/PF00930_21
MRISIGKLQDVSLAFSPASVAMSVPRVPISSLAFQPVVNPANDKYLLLTAGGSAVALWQLTINKSEISQEPDAAKESRPTAPPDQTTRWLHASAAESQIQSERLAFFSDHAPEYVIRVQWSPSGSLWASADGKRVIVFACKVPGDNATWQRQHCILEPSVQEIFDFSFMRDDRLIIGGFGRAIIRTLPDVRPDCSIAVPLEDGEFVKGVITKQIGGDSVLVCLGTSHKSAKIYTYQVSDGTVQLLMIDQYLFTDGPSDHPGLRYASIDPSGQLVAFAYGARKADTFGALYDLKEMERALSLSRMAAVEGDKEAARKAEEISNEAKYRVRGHQTRINCVAFGNLLRPLELRPSDFVQGSKSDISSQARQTLLSVTQRLDKICLANPRWPKYVTYAQSSIEGLVSIWRLFLPSIPEQTVSGVCLTATPHTIVDQAGLISSLDWSCDDRILAVGSDDGKLTCICLHEDDP